MAKLKAGEWIVLVGAVVIVFLAIMVGYIIYNKPPPVQFQYLETTESMAGEYLYRSQGCSACHELFGNGTAVFGPNLDGVGSRHKIAWFLEFLRAPRPGVSDRPYKLKMDPVTLPDKELVKLATYLAAQKALDIDGKIVEPMKNGQKL